MSRRIDIELTSTRDDGTWTWRAAGARQPKGVLDGNLLPDGAAAGDELRADVETTLDGTEVLSVAPPKEKKRPTTETIELVARGPSDDQLVITTLAPKRGRGDRRDRGDRGDRGDRTNRGDRANRGTGRDGDGQRGADRPKGANRSGGNRSGGDRRDRAERGGDQDRAPRGGGRGERSGGDPPRRDRPAPPARPKAKRLRPGRTHRKAALDALAPEEQVIAEQLLRGGVPGVRQAVDKQNEQARAEGRPTVKAEPLLAVADKLLPDLRAAEWRDRAEAAVADLDELDLRDLRSVVVAADTGARDEETRDLAAQLREGLSRRVEREQAAWLAELAETLADGRVVRALRLSSRPPKAGAPLPVDLATRLSKTASASLTADTLVDRWATVLDALSFSPARLTAAPASIPEAPSKELVAAVTRVAARVPKVAEAFGIEAPAEAPRRRPRSGGRQGGSGGAKKPKPPRSSKAAPTEAAPTDDAAPTEAAPTDDAAPTEAAPTDDAAPTEAAPTDDAAIPDHPTPDVPTPDDPTPDDPLPDGPSDGAPPPLTTAPTEPATGAEPTT